jgi:hypothetical protein
MEKTDITSNKYNLLKKLKFILFYLINNKYGLYNSD